MRQKTELRPYQNRLVTELYENDHRLCVVRPGGGKTVAALTAIEELLELKVIRHALVIAPKRVARSVWPDEIALWAHVAKLRYQVLDGSPRERLAQLVDAHNYDVTIIGIDLVQWLVEHLDKLPDRNRLFDLLVIDEVSKLRDPTGKRAQELAKRRDKWNMIWGLSGTLRPGSALDLFMPARVVLGGELWGRSFYQWRQKRFYTTDYHGYDWAPLPGQEEVLNAELAPHVSTLAEAELPQLPELQVLLDYVELPPAARRQYHEMERKLITGDVVAANAAVATGKLAQIANGFVYGEEGEADTHPIHDEKRDWLEDIIEGAAGPTILVYEFKEDLRLIRELLGEDVAFIGLGKSDKRGAAIINDWNAGKVPFLVLHPAAGGHGLNLQMGGADMAWLSPTWSPELWEQTIARLHRSGQKRPVMVRVCVASQTVDVLKLNRVHHKMSAQAAFEAYLREFHARAAP
jgi:SNF2 family DNA or RNA helicase